MEAGKISPIENISDIMDCPDSRDYPFYEMEEYSDGVSSSRPEKEIKLFDQGKTSKCTWYALQHIVNGYNVNEDKRIEGKEVRQQKDPNEYEDNRPHYLQDRLNQFKSLGLIEGWVSIPAQDKDKANLMKKALDRGYLLYTGGAKIDWGKARKTPTISFAFSGIGHAFAIVGYEGDLFKIANSFGVDYGDKGYNYVKAEDVIKLFTTYVVIDKDDTGYFQRFKDQQKAKQMITLAKDLYSTGNSDQKLYFEKIALSKNLTELYK